MNKLFKYQYVYNQQIDKLYIKYFFNNSKKKRQHLSRKYRIYQVSVIN
jgi:hypothetical protein